MTDAERALLLAVAKYVHLHIRDCGLRQRTDLFQAIAAVEAEAGPEETKLGEPCRSCSGHIRENNPERCRTCSPITSQNYERSLFAEPPTEEEINASIKRVSAMMPSSEDMSKAMREAGLLIEKPTEADVCPTCGGRGRYRSRDAFGVAFKECPDCGGTGRKGKK